MHITELQLTSALSIDDKAELLEELNELVHQKGELEEEKKARADAFKRKIDELTAKINVKFEYAFVGEKIEQTTCFVVYNNPEEGRKTLFKIGTGEKVDEQDMTTIEQDKITAPELLDDITEEKFVENYGIDHSIFGAAYIGFEVEAGWLKIAVDQNQLESVLDFDGVKNYQGCAKNPFPDDDGEGVETWYYIFSPKQVDYPENDQNKPEDSEENPDLALMPNPGEDKKDQMDQQIKDEFQNEDGQEDVTHEKVGEEMEEDFVEDENHHSADNPQEN